MKTMLFSSLVGICFIEISMLTVGISMPYHGIAGITRRRPLFVGRRQSPSSSYLNAKGTSRFGKQVSPIFLGRRRNAAFVGKTKIAPLFLGKKGAPLFLGKRSTPMFVGKKMVPRLQGKRSETPMFVGKKSYLESDLRTNGMICFNEDDCPINHCCASSKDGQTKTCIPRGGLGDVCVITNVNKASFDIETNNDNISEQTFCPCQKVLQCHAENGHQIGLCVSKEGTVHVKLHGRNYDKYETLLNDVSDMFR